MGQSGGGGVAAQRRRINRRHWLSLGIASMASFAGSARSAFAAREAPASLAPREARDLAQQLIPFDQLQEPLQDRLWSVVSRTTLHHPLQDKTIPCDPDLYLFFVRNPEVVVSMWQLMGITRMSVTRLKDYVYDAADGMGTEAHIELVYGTPKVHVFLADGAYEGPLLKRRTPGRCVLVLRTDYETQAKGSDQLRNRLDAFMQLDNVGAEIIAKSLQGVLGKTADHNFSETLTFVSRLSQAIERNSSGVERLATRLKNVEPPVKKKFVEVATAANHRAVLRQPAPESNAANAPEILR